MQHSDPDDLFDRAEMPVAPFEFNADVARVFPDMVRRSVPGYADLVALCGLVARRVARPGTHCYDLGCSLGAVSLAMLARTPSGVGVVAVDNAQAMVDGLARRLAEVPGGERVRVCCADVREVEIVDASVVALNLTLQFLPPEERAGLLARIRAGMVPGGVLVLAEKVRLDDAAEAAFVTALHEDFKRANGYSELAIAGKRAALERVLVPERAETHEQRLREVGFARVTRLYQHLNFVAWAAWT
ncbi:carboxy-S-adenosyl-L-methionine synthase CmoA [Marichromatium gracile]|uniref:carboxy-S-adenosyl-L-methionine synthase CmoA n=1 Tax=Marichromatium gracile TaxID=1048 RepID=UPI001F19626A|nr:carboxy-S-adenosyl-L-methionine synthase CmoA [Marichromatium gracile]MCF1184341.1 carboxy-S-adenosyl-L-methionine synthase CmoA [Marichromatium gracile]